MKYYIPIHIDGGNRGCEAITKATSLILGVSKDNIYSYSADLCLDMRLGIGEYSQLIPRREYSFGYKIIRKLFFRFIPNGFFKKSLGYNYIYRKFLDRVTETDVVLSTGGDMMCYDDNQVIYTNEYLYKKNIKSILWGCSIGEKNLTPLKVNTLNHFSKIYARESLTYDLLKSLGLSNVYCFPDPAFILNPQEYNSEMEVRPNTIGLNVSNFIVNESNLTDGIMGHSLQKFLDYIFSKTDLNILMVPHVFWNGQDDRIISNKIYEKNKSTGRISVLDSGELNYCQIRCAISKCRFFIGARTHAMISAYSTCVPSIALGYSAKARGIAKDLELPEYTLVNCKEATDENILLEHFMQLYKNEENIKTHLQTFMPTYISKVWDAKNMIDNL